MPRPGSGSTCLARWDFEVRLSLTFLQMRNLQHEMEVMKEHLEEEADAKIEVNGQLSLNMI